MAREQREASLVASTCRVRAGDLGAARRMAEALLLDTRERGDQVVEKQVCAGILAPLRLLADDAPDAQALLTRVAQEARCVSVIVLAVGGFRVMITRSHATSLLAGRWVNTVAPEMP